MHVVATVSVAGFPEAVLRLLDRGFVGVRFVCSLVEQVGVSQQWLHWSLATLRIPRGLSFCSYTIPSWTRMLKVVGGTLASPLVATLSLVLVTCGSLHAL